MKKIFFAILCIAFSFSVSFGEIVGHWDFNDSLNITKAKIGNDLTLNGTQEAVPGFENGDGAVKIDVGSNYLLKHGILTDSGKVNSYTLVFDIKIASLGAYHSLYQTILENNSDATVFIRPIGSVGLGATGYTDSTLEANKWYRIAIAYKLNERIDYYINGVKELEGDFSDSYVTQIFPLDSAGVLLFADNDGEDNLIFVSDVKLYDEDISDEEISELGGIGIDEPIDENLPEGEELLTNNYFDNGSDNWSFSAQDNADASFGIDSTSVLEGVHSGLVSVVKQGDGPYNWEIELSQHIPGGVIAGKKYHIQYQAKASKEAVLETWIQQWHDGYDPIYSNEISLTTETQTFVDTFEVSQTDTAVVFALLYGAMGDSIDVWVDAVHMIELTPTTSIRIADMNVNKFVLGQNYPNPFNPTTAINFTLTKVADVQLMVYNVLGERVAMLVNSKMAAGKYSINFDASNLPSGVYFYRIKTDKFSQSKKMLLLK